MLWDALEKHLFRKESNSEKSIKKEDNTNKYKELFLTILDVIKYLGNIISVVCISHLLQLNFKQINTLALTSKLTKKQVIHNNIPLLAGMIAGLIGTYTATIIPITTNK